MSFNFLGTAIENEIMMRLVAGSLPTRQLVEETAKKLSVSIRAVYLAIESMERANVIAQTGRRVSLYSLYIEQLRNYTQQIETNYRLEPNILELLPRFRDKTSLTYHFDGYIDLEKFWNQIGISLLKKESHKKPYIFYGTTLYWLSLYSSAAFTYLQTLQSMNYVPFYAVRYIHEFDKPAIEQFRAIGGHISKVPEKLIPFGSEGNLLDDIHIHTTYSESGYTQFLNQYKTSSTGSRDILLRKLETITDVKFTMKRNTKSNVAKMKQILAHFNIDTDIRDWFKTKTPSI